MIRAERSCTGGRKLYRTGIWEGNKRLLSFFLFVFMAAACFVMTNSVVGSVRAASSTGGNIDYSLATLSQAATLYINAVTNPGMDGAEEIVGIKAGNAGGFVGMMDSDASDESYWLASPGAGNSIFWAYEPLSTRIRMGPSPASASDKPGQYALFGYALAKAGLDEVGVGADNDSMRMVVGVAFVALYVLSIGLSSFFNLVMVMLQAANPFRMFATATQRHAGQGGAWIDPYNNGGGTVAGEISGALYDFSVQVGTLYDSLYDISLAILIPAFLAIAVFTWLVINKGQNLMKAFKPLFVRIIFVCIGVPLMFALYDVILEKAAGIVESDNAPATKIVGSLFCDFEAWAESDNNLSLPGTVVLNKKTRSLDSETTRNIRQLCYKINQQSYPGVFNDMIGGGGTSLSEYVNYDLSMMSSTTMPKYTIGGTIQPTTVTDSNDTISTVLDILQRYASGAKISAAVYDSGVAKRILNQDIETGIILFGTSSDWNDYAHERAELFEYDGNDGGGISGGNGGKQANVNIQLTAQDVSNIAMQRWTGQPYGHGMDIFSDGNLEGLTPYNGRSDLIRFSSTSGKALSTMAMYNYLNSEFRDDGVLVTSPDSTNNSMIKAEHYSVSMVGNGFMRIIYMLDGIVLLACTSVIGYGYGFSMMVGNFKGLFKMIPHVLTGMLGSIRGIAAAFALMFALICEVVGTVVLFDVAMTIIYSMYNLIERPLQLLLATFQSIDSSGGNIITALLGIVSIVVMVILCQKLLIWRQAVVGAMTASCTNFVNKLLETNVSAPDLDSSPQGFVAKAAQLGTAGLVLSSAATDHGLVSPETKASLTDAKESFADALTGKDGKGGMLGAVTSAFGVKSDNGTGFANSAGDVGSMSGVTPEQAADIRNRERHSKVRMHDDDTAAKVYSDAQASGFERSIGYVDHGSVDADREDNVDGSRDSKGKQRDDRNDRNDRRNKLAGDELTKNTASEYFLHTGGQDGDSSVQPVNAKSLAEMAGNIPQGESESQTADGDTVTHSRYIDAEGNTVIDSVAVAKDGSTTKSKLVMEDDGSATMVSDTQGVDGSSVHTEEHESADGKTRRVTESHMSDGTHKLVEQSVQKDGAGNVTTMTNMSHSGLTQESNYSSVETSTVSAGGDATVERQVTTAGGTMYVNESRRHDAAGNMVVTSNSVNPDGTHVDSRAVHAGGGSGRVISSSETVYSRSDDIISHTVTDVEEHGAKVITNTVTEAGNSVTTVKDTFVPARNTGVSRTIVQGSGSGEVITTENYVVNNGVREVVNTNVVDTNINVVRTDNVVAGRTRETVSDAAALGASVSPSVSKTAAQRSSGNGTAPGGRQVQRRL